MRPEGAESTLSLSIVIAMILQAAVPAIPQAAVPAEIAPSPPSGQDAAILPVPAPFTPPDPAEPRRIDDPRPLTGFVPQGSYEAGVRGAVARAQNLLGPLDGGWLVLHATGAPLLRLQLVDPGFSGGALEGVWSDQRAGGPDARGFLSGMSRLGTTVTMQFARPGAGASTLTLQPRAEGGYAGDLVSAEVGRPETRTAVTMVRP